MKKIKLPSYGCSQESHVKNCGHFGESGGYLSRHADSCPNNTGNFECNCNPTARAEMAFKEATLRMPFPLFNLLTRMNKKDAQAV